MSRDVPCRDEVLWASILNAKAYEGAIRERQGQHKFKSKELAVRGPKGHGDNVDRISELPDDILISIISRLTLREAIATSILSARWRHLYHHTARLDFPSFSDTLPFHQVLHQEIDKRFLDYIKMINRTLDSYKGNHVKEFKIHMYSFEGANIEKWLDFVLSRGVESIRLHIDHVIFNSLQITNLFGMKCGTSLTCGLKEISLSNVQVSDGEVQLLLANFPLLETLSITGSDMFRNLLIVGHSGMKLKRIDISYAVRMKSIEIHGMTNLVSLTYITCKPAILRLSDVPKLTDVTIALCRHCTLSSIFHEVPSCVLSQLLQLHIFLDPRTIPYSAGNCEYVNVKRLTLAYRSDYSSISLYGMVETCPSLEELEIKLLRSCPFKVIKCTCGEGLYNFPPTKKFSPNLRKLKLTGYIGCPCELEYVLYIIKNAVTLKLVIVKPCDLSQDIAIIVKGRIRLHLRPQIPSSVNLVVI
ncbi:unnamed protein product [Cuscuta europaea]|uniref:F-box domain-containing protein n=1 Tax=Cuscuta europaea TaxID=41803 RepID=A0A9P1EGV2_CUSEU|nr:unnamed protein product [Cuscuta europaea]